MAADGASTSESDWSYCWITEALWMKVIDQRPLWCSMYRVSWESDFCAAMHFIGEWR